MAEPIILTVDEIVDVLLLPTRREASVIVSELVYAREIPELESEKILEKVYYETVEQVANDVLSKLFDVEVKLTDWKFKLTPKKRVTWKDVADRLAPIGGYISDDDMAREKLKNEYLLETGKESATYREVVQWALPIIRQVYEEKEFRPDSVYWKEFEVFENIMEDAYQDFQDKIILNYARALGVEIEGEFLGVLGE